jgi:hypothetical protein
MTNFFCFEKKRPAYWYGRSMSNETKKLMSLKRKGELNPLYGKLHSEESKELMRQKALGRKYSEETKLLMSTASPHSNPVNIYEKCSSGRSAPSVASGTRGEGFKLIGSFVSARRAGKFLEISGSTASPRKGLCCTSPSWGSTIIRYMKSGAIFKDRYKFSSK